MLSSEVIIRQYLSYWILLDLTLNLIFGYLDIMSDSISLYVCYVHIIIYTLYTYICVYIYVYMYILVYIYISIYIY